MPKQRVHNEYFRTVSCGNRKSCPTCKEKLLPGESIWSWGEYIYAKWHTVRHFCKCCYPDIRRDLEVHRSECGCDFQLVGYSGTRLPDWLTIGPCVTTDQFDSVKRSLPEAKEKGEYDLNKLSFGVEHGVIGPFPKDLMSSDDMLAKKVDGMVVSLKDCCDGSETEGESVNVSIHADGRWIWIGAEGFGEPAAQDGHGTPIGLEYYNGRLRLVVYNDINEQDPQIIDMEDALESNRREE